MLQKLLVKKYAKNGEAAGDLIGNKTADKNYINKQSKTQKWNTFSRNIHTAKATSTNYWAFRIDLTWNIKWKEYLKIINLF